MFSTVPMKRLSVVVLGHDERTVLRALGAMGAVHLVRTAAGPDTAPNDPPDRSEELRRCDALLTRIDRVARNLEIEDLSDPGHDLPPMTLEEVERILAPIEARSAEVLQARSEALQAWGQVTHLLDQVEPYAGLDVSFDQLGRFSFLHFAIGSLPAEQLEAVSRGTGENVVLLPMTEEGGRQRLVAITSRKGRFALETALENAGFRHEEIAEPEPGTMHEILERARHRKEQLAEELRHPREAIQRMRDEVARPLGELRASVTVERKIYEAEESFPRTDSTVLLTGWIPEDDVPRLREGIKERVGGRFVLETEEVGDVPEEEVPVLVRHPRLLRPFGLLVAGYGLPGYRELEPTLFVAVTFLVMFGMMFGDLGHGAVLLLGGLGALIWGKREKVKDAGVLLLFAGLSSVAFGLIYGEVFGAALYGHAGLLYKPEILTPEGTKGLIRNAIIIGVIVLSIGLVLNIINRFRKGDVVGGFLDKFGLFGAVFYWGVLALGIKWAVREDKTLHWLEVVLLIILPLVALALKEPIQYALAARAGRKPHSENLLMAFVESAIEMFEAVLSYMANTISFVRLAAYAMSHAAILMATFMMAREMERLVGGGGLGSTLGVVVLILGNILTILLEGIIAAVQALRLEYYEFFGKFFSGSGRAFTPFRLRTREPVPTWKNE